MQSDLQTADLFGAPHVCVVGWTGLPSSGSESELCCLELKTQTIEGPVLLHHTGKHLENPGFGQEKQPFLAL